MIGGILEIEKRIFEAMSLKDNRRVVKSLKDRISHKFNVSITEVNFIDSICGGVLGVAMVANEKRFVESALHKIVDYVKSNPRVSLIDYNIEMV